MKERKLREEIGEVEEHLAKKQDAFDTVMQTSRDMIRDAGRTITLLHNGSLDEASARLNALGRKSKQLMKIDGDFRYNTMQAYQEYAEAFIFSSIKTKRKVPCREEIGIDYDAYLMGLMDVVGELKREILESLRAGDLKTAEFYFDTMKDIYDSTRSLRFAEAVLPGFRKKQDVARIQIENAGGEILSFRKR